ncbi:MAG: NAD-dependent epimerase/dehydratase family protein [Clostridia bacterium]
MAEILVLGGTRFFGRRLVNELLQHGHAVTVASRGMRADDLGSTVARIRLDRTDPQSMKDALWGREFDVVYDQIGYNPREAKSLLDAMGDRMGRLVFCSTGSVYDAHDGLITEDDFDPSDYPVDLDAAAYEYGEGKRQAEAYLVRFAPCPVVLARPSFVVSGTDDYTERFDFHVRHVLEGRSVGVHDPDYTASFITAWDAGRALYFAGLEMEEDGPLNVVNPGYYNAAGMTRRIAAILGREARIHQAADDDPDLSPYTLPGEHRVDVVRAAKLGFTFPPLDPALPGMVEDVVRRLQA